MIKYLKFVFFVATLFMFVNLYAQSLEKVSTRVSKVSKCGVKESMNKMHNFS